MNCKELSQQVHSSAGLTEGRLASKFMTHEHEKDGYDNDSIYHSHGGRYNLSLPVTKYDMIRYMRDTLLLVGQLLQAREKKEKR